MYIEKEGYNYEDVLMIPNESTSISSRSEVNLEVKYHFKYSKKIWSGVPIIAANMYGVGTIEMMNILYRYKMMTMLHKFYSIEELSNAFSFNSFDNSNDTAHSYNQLEKLRYTIISTGIQQKDILKTEELYQNFPGIFPPFICIDIANGHMKRLLEIVESARNIVGDSITIIAGNVATSEATDNLIKAGADIVKVGIGPGSHCTTRNMTGIGVPQLTAVYNCAKKAHALNAHIISDGGIKEIGDIGKAFGVGADFVMLGGMLAGHKESEEELEIINDSPYLPFYGMSSEEAMKRSYGEVNDYRASEGSFDYIPYKGSVEKTVKNILGGLRSTCSYLDCENLSDVRYEAKFMKVRSIK